jgi:hypothetical protein
MYLSYNGFSNFCSISAKLAFYLQHLVNTYLYEHKCTLRLCFNELLYHTYIQSDAKSAETRKEPLFLGPARGTGGRAGARTRQPCQSRANPPDPQPRTRRTR